MAWTAHGEGRGPVTRIHDKYNHLPDIKRELNHLAGHTIIAGVLPNESGFLKMIAIVNEYGAHIKPKNGPYLYVPGPKGAVYKLKSVDIPARSFLRQTYDAKHKRWQKQLYRGAQRIVKSNDRVKASEVMISVGADMQREIRQAITRKKSPKNAPLTIANKGKNDPLVDTGRLGKAIKYRIKKGR